MISIIRADARQLPLPDASVDLVVTSPPYFGLRSYTDGGEHYAGQIGSEATPAAYVAALVECTAEWVRCLKPGGSIFVNLGDKYSGYFGPNWKHDRNPGGGERMPRGYRDDLPVSAPTAWGIANKSLMGLPWRYALACTDQLGLILRAEIIWAKPNGLPESVQDRVRRAHEQVFHFTRQPRYYSAVDEIREQYADPTDIRAGTANGFKAGVVVQPGDGRSQRNDGVLGVRQPRSPLGKLPGSVWSIPSQPLTVPPDLGADHFAAFPMELPRRIILGWSPPGVCTACGQGRRPVADKRYASQANGYSSAGRWGLKGQPEDTPLPVRLGDGSLVTITGYACACPAPDALTRPAIVLDPFGGTGTTALLASVNGRHGITVDRSADYCRIAAWRCSDPRERAAAMEVPRPAPVSDDQLAMFDQ